MIYTIEHAFKDINDLKRENAELRKMLEQHYHYQQINSQQAQRNGYTMLESTGVETTEAVIPTNNE